MTLEDTESTEEIRYVKERNKSLKQQHSGGTGIHFEMERSYLIYVSTYLMFHVFFIGQFLFSNNNIRLEIALLESFLHSVALHFLLLGSGYVSGDVCWMILKMWTFCLNTGIVVYRYELCA